MSLEKLARIRELEDQIAELRSELASLRSDGPWRGVTISPVDWYVATMLVRFEYDDEDKKDLNRRCRAWRNTILFKASSPDEAYEKAMARGALEAEAGDFWEEGNESHTGHTVFEGLTSLLAVYDEIEDGAEIIWADYENRMVKTVKGWVKSKEELEVFEQARQG